MLQVKSTVRPLLVIAAVLSQLVSAQKGALTPEHNYDLRYSPHAGSDPLLDRLEVAIRAGQSNKVEPQLVRYLEDHPGSSRAHYDLGYIEFLSHKIGSSVAQLSRSLELDPKNAEAHKVLALDCSIIGRYDLAESELIQALHLSPGSAEIHYFLARAYYMRGVYPLAKKEFANALQIDPSYEKAYTNLGITMEALGNNDAALTNYTKAIRLEDAAKNKSEWPYVYMAAFYNRQNDPSGALQYAKEASQINPKSDVAHFELTKAYRGLRQFAEAIGTVHKAISINPSVPDYYYVLGLLLRDTGNRKESEEAFATYKKALSSANSPSEARSSTTTSSRPEAYSRPTDQNHE
jgi:tetratricopeptide (TPR) repeat protein